MRKRDLLLCLGLLSLPLAGCSDISGGEIDVLTSPPLDPALDVDELTLVEGTAVSVRFYAIAGGGRLDPSETEWTFTGDSVAAVSSMTTEDAGAQYPTYFTLVAQHLGDTEVVGTSVGRGGQALLVLHVVPQPEGS